MTRRRTAQYLFLLIAGLLLGGWVLQPVAAQDTLRHAEEHEDADHYEHSFDNPERYADRWNDPERDAWQQPDAILRAMEISEGMFASIRQWIDRIRPSWTASRSVGGR